MVERTTAAAAPRGSSAMVIVACKLPLGLILHLYRMEDDREATPNGYRTIKVSRRVGDPVKLNGTALKFGEAPEHPMPAGYALTAVPRDFWEQWLEQNKDADCVINRVVFAESSAQATTDRAREQAQERDSRGKAKPVKSGLEPMDPKNLPPVGLGMRVKSYEQTTDRPS